MDETTMQVDLLTEVDELHRLATVVLNEHTDDDELVTNAVKATGITDPEPKWSALQKLNLISVRIVGLEDSIVFEVWDASPEEPTAKEAAPDDEGGRGLDVVEALAKRWGSYAHRGGKVVWAELPVFTATSSGHGSPKQPPTQAAASRRARSATSTVA